MCWVSGNWGALGIKERPPWGPDRFATRRVSSVSMGSVEAGRLGTPLEAGTEDEDEIDIFLNILRLKVLTWEYSCNETPVNKVKVRLILPVYFKAIHGLIPDCTRASS